MRARVYIYFFIHLCDNVDGLMETFLHGIKRIHNMNNNKAESFIYFMFVCDE